MCKNELYDSSKNRAILKDLWTKIATRYKDNPVVAAYDILNEPQNNGGYSGANAWAPGSNEALSRTYSVYDEMYKAIRAVDSNHVISMEAIWSGNCLPDPRNYGWSNLLYQMHIYDTSIDMIDTRVNELKYYQSEYGVAVYAGEFNCDPNEEYAMSKFNEAGINWTTWAYKGAKQGVGNNWFLYVKNIPYVDADTDSYETILNKWGSVLKTSNFDVNEGTVKRWIMNYVNGAVADQGNSAVGGQGQGEATLADGEYFFEAVDSGKIVCAGNAGNDPLVASMDSYGGAWETFNIVNNGDGTISLKSGANGKYVCAVIDDCKQLLARSETIGTWEKFKLIKVSDTEYALKACANNKFVCVDQINGNVLYADRDSISGWESFRIYKVNGSQTNVDSDNSGNSSNSSNQGSQSGALANGEYFFVASDGKVVCAEDAEGNPVIANRDSYGGAWETFTIVNNDDNTISLKSGTNGNYVCAVIDAQNQLSARSETIGTWEKFYLERLSSGNFALKSCANDKYVCADQNNNNILYADRDSAGGWEIFQIYTTSGDFVE